MELARWFLSASEQVRRASGWRQHRGWERDQRQVGLQFWKGKVLVVGVGKLSTAGSRGLPRTPSQGRKAGSAPAEENAGLQLFGGGGPRSPQASSEWPGPAGVRTEWGSVPRPPMCPAKVGPTLRIHAGGLSPEPLAGSGSWPWLGALAQLPGSSWAWATAG